MKKQLLLRPLDVVFLALALGVTALSFVHLGRTGASGAVLVIDTPDAQYAYSLAKNATVRVAGTLGESVITIADGAAAFADSPCPNKLCVHAGALRHNGDVAACLPNNVLIHIEAKRTAAVDSVSD